jgi:chemotaxis protein MotA
MVVNFLCNTLAVIIDAEISPEDMDTLLDIEIDTYRREVMEVPHAVAKTADGIPGIGIVAAVLGVVITMGLIDQPPTVLGESIGAALLGTFLGVLMCYGFVSPFATHLEHKAQAEVVYFSVIKIAVVAFLRGTPGKLAVEFAKRAIPSHQRGGSHGNKHE